MAEKPLLSDSAFEAFKRRLVPVLYDWFMHYHLAYPTQTCRWGPLVEDLGHKSRYQAYLSEQVLDGSRPNTLVLAHIDVFKPHVASCEAVSSWTEKSRSQEVAIVKTIYHPGEVNKVRELPQHPQLLVTHTDSSSLFLWNMERQPDRRPAGAGLAGAGTSTGGKSTRQRTSSASDPSLPDLTLVGHEEEAQFPLACSSTDPRVASGGSDTLVLLWDLGDHVSSLLGPGGGGGGGRRSTPELKARYRLEGHTATVGDLVFQPLATSSPSPSSAPSAPSAASSNVLLSVADDGRLITWDVRSQRPRVGCVEAAHGAGVNVLCVDWSSLDDNMVVTGAQDGSLHVWDRRRMSAAADRIAAFDAHRNSEQREIIHVEWHPSARHVFASGAQDHTVALWDLTRTAHLDNNTPASGDLPTAAGAAVGGGGGAGRSSRPTGSSGAATTSAAAEAAATGR
ncbi:hypothetical protein Agub_g4373, partial [Astrephomene gubernaculifera]